MGKLRKLEIHFLNCAQSAPVFYAGQTISGQLVIELSEPMKMRGIRVTFEGSADVRWSERHSTRRGGKTHHHTVHYHNHETYFKQVVTLYGKQEGESGDDPTLAAGLHNFNFQFTLPMNLPSSFEGLHGHVRYFLKGVVDRPWKFDHTIKAAFTVLSHLDLNMRQGCALGTDVSDDKVLCCCCCKAGPITVRARIPRTGYVPGQVILVTVEIDNNTNRKCDFSEVTLREVCRFHATTKSKTTHKDICTVRGAEIRARQNETWTAELLIPPTPPSELIYCNIIDINYVIVVKLSPSGPALSMELTIPLLIGTIPLRELFSSFATPAPPLEVQPTAPLPPGFENYPDAPPPSYSELFSGPVNIKGEDDSDYTMGNLNYAPVYPYYGQ